MTTEIAITIQGYTDGKINWLHTGHESIKITGKQAQEIIKKLSLQLQRSVGCPDGVKTFQYYR